MQWLWCEVGNHESSPNYMLWLWVPDLRSASLRLSGTTLGREQRLHTRRHCEERSDEAIQNPFAGTVWNIRYTRNDGAT